MLTEGERSSGLAAFLAAAALTAAGCGGAGTSSSSADRGRSTSGNCSSKHSVTLESKWVVQAQFAGYYAAKAKGCYRDRCLDVTIRPGGTGIAPEQVVEGGEAEFGIDWLPSLLATREQGGDVMLRNEGVDTTGGDWRKATVTVAPGGK